MSPDKGEGRPFDISVTVASWETGPGGSLAPQALLRYLEEAAWRHAEEGALSAARLADAGVFWGLVRQRVLFLREVPRGERLTVTTWHAGHDRAMFYRCFVVRGEDGGPVCRAVSAWTMVDRVRRRMFRPSAVPVAVPDGDPGELSDLLPEPLPPLAAPGEGEGLDVGFRDLDRNGHVNNVRYMEWFFDSLPDALLTGSRLTELWAEFRSEVFHGERLLRAALPGEGGAFEHGLFRENGKAVCRARSVWRQATGEPLGS